MRRPGDAPQPLGEFLRRVPGRARPVRRHVRPAAAARLLRRRDRRGRREIADVPVDRRAVDADLADFPLVLPVREQRRQLQAVHRLVVGELERLHRIAHDVVVDHLEDPGRQLGRRVDRQGQLRQIVDGDVDHALRALGAAVRQLRVGTERGAHQGQRVAQVIEPAAARLIAERRRGVLIGRVDVERDRPVEPLNRSRRRVSDVEHILDHAGELESGPAVGQIVGALHVAELFDRRLEADVVVIPQRRDADEVAGAFEQHGLDRHDAIPSAEGGGGVVDDLLFRRLRRRGQQQSAGEGGDCPTDHVAGPSRCFRSHPTPPISLLVVAEHFRFTADAAQRHRGDHHPPLLIACGSEVHVEFVPVLREVGETAQDGPWHVAHCRHEIVEDLPGVHRERAIVADVSLHGSPRLIWRGRIPRKRRRRLVDRQKMHANKTRGGVDDRARSAALLLGQDLTRSRGPLLDDVLPETDRLPERWPRSLDRGNEFVDPTRAATGVRLVDGR